jgi:hypothetical protein
MNEPHTTPDFGRPGEKTSALFASMVIQQTNVAMMLLGKVPHPETGKTLRDLESARMFIDQLEMLQVKTKGNLNREEQALLKQSLMSLQMAFVDAVESPAPSAPETAPPPPAPASPAEPSAAAPQSGSDAVSEDESKKKFSKKY